MKILLAVDDSPCSQAAINSVAERPWPAGSEIKVITSVEFPILNSAEFHGMSDRELAEFENAEQERVEAFIRRTVNQLLSAGKGQLIVTGTVFKPGDARELILEEAERWKPDLIVVGSHGRRGFQRFWLGSVSQAVAAHAPCSVEIVRCPAAGLANAPQT